ncbi:MAG: biotin--[acetyl-CoA-carboxylase] ligase [Gammaproteobacteria bacterium]
MRRAFDLLELLADRAEHSGADLAAALGVSRAAVWNQVARLREEGVDIVGTPGQGYVLEAGFDKLDADAMRAELEHAGCRSIRALDVLTVTDSTNEQLLTRQTSADIHGHALFAEYQSAGRGRRGDKWLSPPGSGLTFSLGWRFDAPPSTFSALSLVIGLALARALDRHGIDTVRLKWPNDIVRGDRKMAGILIEMRAEAGGPCVTVIGIGLNVSLSVRGAALIDRPSDDVTTALGAAVSRNALAADVLASLVEHLEQFGREGFEPFRDAWCALDALRDREVTLDLGGRVVTGRARGVDDHGALLIEDDGRLESFVSGHLTRV